MKILKKLTAVLLCLTVFFGAFSTVTASAAEVATDDEVGASITEDSEVGYSEVKGKTVSQVLGMDYGQYLSWLYEHQSDDYYLGTPYQTHDSRNPNGDCSGAYGTYDTKGVAAMNCTGFVWHALYKATKSSGGKTSIIPAESGWVSFYRSNNISRRYFSSKSDMLSSGYLSKGDIIWMFEYGSESTISDGNHIGIYYGNGSSDVLWHSLDSGYNGKTKVTYGGNVQSVIAPKSKNNILYVVVKVGSGNPLGKVTLTKKDSTTNKVIAGSQWKLYTSAGKGVTCTGSGGTYTYSKTSSANALSTNSSGKLTISGLPYGSYYLKEYKAPDGYKLSTDKLSFTISKSAKSKTVTANNNPYIHLQLLKVSSNTTVTNGNSNYSLSGAVYNIYTNATCTGTAVGSITTDSDGYGCYKFNGISSGTNTNDSKSSVWYNKDSGYSVELKSGTTYYCKEYKAPTGFAKSSTIYKFVDSGKTDSGGVKIYRTSKTVSDTPAAATEITINKENEDGDKLAGAQFTVKYYPNYYNNTNALPKTADRVWVLLSDSNGVVKLTKDYLDSSKSSSNFFYSDGRLPLGTVTIQETAAPVDENGNKYCIDSTVYVAQIVADSKGYASVKWVIGSDSVTNNALTVTNDTADYGAAQLRKVSDDGYVSGIKFKLYRFVPGVKNSLTTVGTYTTNSSGIINADVPIYCDEDNSSIKYQYVWVEQNVQSRYETPYLTEDMMKTAYVIGNDLYYTSSGKAVKIDSDTTNIICLYPDNINYSLSMLTDMQKVASTADKYKDYDLQWLADKYTDGDTLAALKIFDANGDGVITASSNQSRSDDGYLINRIIAALDVTSVIYANTLRTGNAKITKTCADGNVSGIKFKITADSIGFAAYYTTGEDGTFTAENLQVYDNDGSKVKYTVTEVDVDTAKYYTPLAETITLTEGKTTAVGFENKAKIKLQLAKVSSDTTVTSGNSCYSLEGAVYNIYTNAACTGSVVGTITTDADGYGCYGTGSGATNTNDSESSVWYGKDSGASLELKSVITYYCKEVTAPAGYAINNTKYKFTDSGVTDSDGTPIYRTSTTVSDKPVSDPMSASLVVKQDNNGNALADARFTVKFYAGYYTASTLPSSATRTWVLQSDRNGDVKVKSNYKVDGDDFYTSDGRLPLGTVTIQETTAPTGYALDSTLYICQIVQDGNSATKKWLTSKANVTNESLTVTDNKYIKLQLLKTSSNPDVTDDNSYYSLEGAVYNIYTNATCTGTAVGSITTDADGYGCYGTGSAKNNASDDKGTTYYGKNSGKSVELKSGVTYYCKEVTAPAGYALSSTVYEFVNEGISASDGAAIYRAYKLYSDCEEDDIPMDTPTYGDVKLTKKDSSTKKILTGSQWQLYTSDDTIVKTNMKGVKGSYTYAANGSYTVLETNSSGVLTVDRLPYGSYYLKEYKAPNGYQISTRKYRFTVTSTTASVEKIAYNGEINGSVTLVKEDGYGNSLYGSQWQLYTKSGVPVLLYQTDDGYYKYNKTDSSGEATTMNAANYVTSYAIDPSFLTVNDLPKGSYYFIETKAPSGYMPYGKKLEFEITGSGSQTLNVDLEVIDNKIILSDTGAGGAVPFYAAGACFAALAAVFIIYHFKSKSKNRKENAK